MQTLSFTYNADGASTFDLELTSHGERITNSDLVLMGKYIRVLFATIRQIGNVSNASSADIDEMIRDLMRGEDE